MKYRKKILKSLKSVSKKRVPIEKVKVHFFIEARTTSGTEYVDPKSPKLTTVSINMAFSELGLLCPGSL